MSDTNNRHTNFYTQYIVGVGMGTALSPILISALGAEITDNKKWVVVGIGVIIILSSYIVSGLQKKQF